MLFFFFYDGVELHYVRVQHIFFVWSSTVHLDGFHNLAVMKTAGGTGVSLGS